MESQILKEGEKSTSLKLIIVSKSRSCCFFDSENRSQELQNITKITTKKTRKNIDLFNA